MDQSPGAGLFLYPMMKIKLASTTEELEAILALQKQNLEDSLESTELNREGFVTVRHSLALLEKMNSELPSVIAIDQGKLAGYTLSMTSSFREDIPVLIPMFQLIDRLSYKGRNLSQLPYLVGGQICIDKAFRGQGLFYKLYHFARSSFDHRFPVMLTEVSDRNPRSVHAHLKCGFEIIHEYRMHPHEKWSILAWDWRL